MQLDAAIKSRRSIRKFKPDPVSDKAINALLEAARLAPSGSNLQPSRYIVIKSKEARGKLNECTPLPFVSQAPVVIACCADSQAMTGAQERFRELKEAGAFAGTPLEDTNDSSLSRRRSGMDEATAKAYLSLNVAIAIDHMTLKAVDLGLGTCWVMMFDQDKIKEAFNLDERYNIVALLPVGYPDQDPKLRPRLELKELILTEL